ncbi:MAG: FAD-binding oxidoreductase [Mycobacteriales bacterium]
MSILSGLSGQVLLPGDEGYDTHRRVWNAMVDRRPAVIARCATPADVATAVRFARGNGLEIGVRCGGHGVLGFAVPAGGLMIDLSPLGGVTVDPDRRRARVQGGALLGALDRATQPYGLATTAGNVSHTGVGGLTLGGGMGWLARQYGLACDNVVSYQVVLASGDTVRASEAENADLYWALRGGGGNFGVVTEFEFLLHRTGTQALLTELYYTPDDAPKALRGWRDLLADAPRRATLTAWAGTAGDWPHLPAELRGRPLASVGYVWIGDPDAGRGLLDQVSAVAPPAAERMRSLSYLDLQTMDDNPQGHQWRRYSKGYFLRDLTDDALDAFLSRGAEPGEDPARLPGAGFQAYGGAIAEIAPDETAFGHRDTLVEFSAGTRWADPAEDEWRTAAARRYGAAMEPHASGAYVNNVTDEGAVGRAYRADQLTRLAAVKDRYDPDNAFRLNHNIRPASAAVPSP